MSIDRRWRRMAGISMIELIFFIVIVSVAIAGVLSVLNVSVKSSADPQQRKQALAIAEALLEEVEMMPFTFCDPDDPNAAGATSSNDCTGNAGGANDQGTLPLAHQPGEARGNLATPFDNVADYNGFTIVGGAANSTDIGGAVAVPTGYTAQVAVVQEAFGPANPPAAQVPAAAALRITVTVSYNGGADSIALEGYRTRYAPNFTP